MRLDATQMRHLVRRARVARLAMQARRGALAQVPICFVLLDDVLYSAVDAKPKSTTALARLESVRAHPSVSVLIDHYDDNAWETLWWVRLSGVATVLDDLEARAHIDALCEKYEQYRVARPGGPVIAIRIESWLGWSASAPL